jgi:hypothetical protein
MKRKHIQGCNCCDCTATIVVSVVDACSGAALNNTTLKASRPGQADIIIPTGAATGATFHVPTIGGWTITGTRTTYTTSSIDVAIGTCGQTVNVLLKLTVAGQVTGRNFNVKGCGNLNVPNVTIDLYKSGVFVTTKTTDGAGNADFTGLSAGAYTAQVSKDRFVSTSSSFSLACGSHLTTNVVLTAATGWRCNTACADPLPSTVYVTDPVLGLVALPNHTGCILTPAISGVRTSACFLSSTALRVPVRFLLTGSNLQIDIQCCDTSGSGGSFPEGVARNGACPLSGASNVDYFSYVVPLAISSCLSFSASGSKTFAKNSGFATPATQVYGEGVGRTWTLSQ